jgi:signal transduction histidine kinase/HAMP domain-containing protein
MKILPTLISDVHYIDPLPGLVGWLSWLVLLGIIVFLLWNWRGFNKSWNTRQGIIFVALALLVPIAGLFAGVRLSPGNALPLPWLPLEPVGPAVMVFAAVPWILAAGLLGPTPAAILASLSGLVLALWDTHNPFTPLEFALLAVLFSGAINQRFRTPLFQLLRHPIVAALALTLVYPLIYMIFTPVMVPGVVVSRLDYTLTHMWAATLAAAVGLLVGGLFAEVVMLIAPTMWGSQGLLIPSPTEKSLQTRFLYNMAPLALVLLLTLMAGDWIIAGNAARGMLRDRMTSTAMMSAESVPFYLQSGQTILEHLSKDSRLYTGSPEEQRALLEQAALSMPFFKQIYLLDVSGNSSTGYPEVAYAGPKAPVNEQMGVQNALNGMPFQFVTIPPGEDQTAAQVSFVKSVLDENQTVRGVLVGHSDLGVDPLMQPALENLKNMNGIDGQGFLVDSDGNIIFHPDSDMVMQAYSGPSSNEAQYYDDTAPDGTRRLVYYQPAKGASWAVVLTVPAHRAQQLALQIAVPLLGIILILSVLFVIVLRLGLRVVTGSLQTLSLEAGRISQGQLDHKLPVEGEDEVGRLRRAFEHMRTSLKARLDELNRLLVVSRGVASNLEMKEAVKPILESALAAGGCAARVVLSPSVVPDLDGGSVTPVSYSMGPAQDLYRDLDEQILALTRQQERLVLTNPSRPRLLSFAAGTPRPESLMAVALRHENLFFGSLWVAYDQPHQFSEEEVRFLVTLGSQAALAAANARLFRTAEIGRQRLAAILSSTPDPVLVTDQHDRLLLANPAAWQVLGLSTGSEGTPVEKVISQKQLLDLLRSTADEKQSLEVTLPGGKVYLATASSVLADGQRVGRVCALRDVTYLKELDALKSEFVSTVSHDLRSPLTLMRGYATMLEMVGELNEQQISYVRKIITGVESMSRLVNNLLDLGRIEAGIGLQLEMVPVQDIVDRVTNALQLQANQKRIQLTTEIIKDTAPLVEADQALLQQALHNLVENAIKFTRADGKVTVRVQSRADRMVFEVIDTGTGISPMDQPHLFEKFYRASQAGQKDQRGTGLGLAIVKSIAERHGGQVGVVSQLGKGSTFYLAIPLKQPKLENTKRAG